MSDRLTVRIHLQKDGFDYGNTPDFSDREVDKLRLSSVYGGAFLLAVYPLSAALDVADLFLAIVAQGPLQNSRARYNRLLSLQYLFRRFLQYPIPAAASSTSPPSR